MALVKKPKIYQAFRGVDYSASPAVISDDHASDMLNMYVGDDGVMQKRPGWHIVKDFEAPINGIHYLHRGGATGIMFVHAGTKLYGAQFVTNWRHFDAESGDVPFFRNNNDGPTPSDASFILRYIAGLVTVEPWQARNMDLDGNGVVNEEDAYAILRMLVGLQPFPIGAGVMANSFVTVKNESSTDFALANRQSVSFVHEDKLYILDGSGYYVIEPTYSTENGIRYISAYVGKSVAGYIPTTGVNGHYEYDELNEEGTNTPGSQDNPGVWVRVQANEARNMLNHRQINTFTADGIHDTFYLSDNNCEVEKVEKYVKKKYKVVNGQDVVVPDEESETGVKYYWKYTWVAYETTDYTVTQATNSSSGMFVTSITFSSVPAVQDDGAVNLRVTFAPHSHSTASAIAKDRGYIEKATVVTRFGYFNDNRFFFTGNPDHKNMDLMSAVDDPTYIPNTGWTLIGSHQTAIIGYLHYGSELAILKEDNDLDATVYMRSARLGEDNNIYFPVQQGAEGVGAISKYAICTLRDDPLFLTKQGVFAIQGTDASQERNIPNRSFYIDKRLKDEISRDSVAVNWGNYFLLASPTTGRCYVADARLTEPYNGSFVYDWCVWDNIPAKVFKSIGDLLFFGTQDGKLCRFNSDWTDMRKYSDGGTFVAGSTNFEGSAPYSEGVPIYAYYVTKRDHLNAIDYKKTILNDGGVITLIPYSRSSAQILIRTEKGEFFIDDIQTDSDEPSVVVPIRKRIKWFDSIQTRVENNRLNEGLAILGIQYRYSLETNRR